MRRIVPSLAALSLAVAVGCSSTDSDEDEIGRVIRVPSDEPTIQAAIDTADGGDMILVADGVYSGHGNRDIDFLGKAIVLKSENGPALTVIDCAGSSSEHHSGLSFVSGEGEGTVVDGFTIRGGYVGSGAGIRCKSSSPTVKNCVLSGNTALVSGGAVHCKFASPRFINCTFVLNRSPAGAGVFCISTACPVLQNCIIALSEEGEAVGRAEGTSNPTLRCCDVFGNENGDWVGCIAGQAGLDGNFSLDPLFCDAANNDFHLDSRSPCGASLSGCGTLVGALGIGCVSDDR